MFAQTLLLPFVVLFSAAATLTRHIGNFLPAANLHRILFDLLIGGRGHACDVRDELLAATERYLIENEVNIESSQEELLADLENSRQKANTTISSGEFVLALLFGVAGFYISAWFAFGISVVIALSASIRVTAIDSLAITSPDNPSIEWLMAARAWNQGAIKEGRLLLNTALAVWVREFDEKVFEVFIQEVFLPTLEQGEISAIQAAKNLLPQVIGILKERQR
ncbi:hypothetical protein [Natrinema limicola]|nr:hypothetical protein [Natrinema limicola]